MRGNRFLVSCFLFASCLGFNFSVLGCENRELKTKSKLQEELVPVLLPEAADGPF